MRRVTRLLAVPAVAAVLAGFCGGTAHAASGTLYIGNIPYADPAGCKNGAGRAFQLDNDTDGRVFVHPRRDCGGPVIAVIEPGDDRTVPGQSVFVE
ncbi:MAG: hypothetical protein GEV07_09180 [Streptosporangiales bacterium]|nr:hypothetical protein [Streptosporangiales bacterium]